MVLSRCSLYKDYTTPIYCMILLVRLYHASFSESSLKLKESVNGG